MTISIRLEPELEKRISNLAEEAMENIRKGKSKLYSQDEVRKELGLDN
ncbi:MAG: hypothetical protein RLZZ210_215 [Pseudomonadota bacterium]